MLRPALVQAAAAALRELQQESAAGGPGLVVTLPWAQDGHVLQRRGARGRRPRRAALQARAAELRRLRREARLRAGPAAGAGRSSAASASACRSARTSGIPACVAHLAAAGAQLLLVPNGSPFEVEKFHQRLDLARQRVVGIGAAARLRQPGRRPGRAGLRRRLVRHECRRLARARPSLLARGARPHDLGMPRRPVPLRRRAHAGPKSRRDRHRSTARWCWGCATTCGRTGSAASCSDCPAASTRR